MSNSKMIGVAMTILDVMTDVFPHDYRDFVFAGLLNPGDVVEMVSTGECQNNSGVFKRSFR